MFSFDIGPVLLSFSTMFRSIFFAKESCVFLALPELRREFGFNGLKLDPLLKDMDEEVVSTSLFGMILLSFYLALLWSTGGIIAGRVRFDGAPL